VRLFFFFWATSSMARCARSVGRNAMWFRADLRLDDHPALHAACSSAESLLPVFVFDPAKFNVLTLGGSRKSSARRARFLVESVSALRASLESKGSGLVVGLGRTPDVLARFCESCSEVHVSTTVCSEEKIEERQVEKRLGELKRTWGGTLYAPEECGNDLRHFPLLFTSFKNKAEGRGRVQSPLDAPKRFPPLPDIPEIIDALKFLPSLEQLGYSVEEAIAAAQDDPRGVMVFRGGEETALARMQKWMFDDDKLKDYFDIRNGMLGEGYSSKFSPWIALGCLSPRRVWKEAQRYERERVKNKSTYWLVFELTWRDFYIYMALTQGDKIFLRGGIVGDTSPWRGTRDALERWKTGQTGDQLVDANMRELNATGFMSNRGRQNVASFLIFNLEVDWRLGAAHFEEHLLDYDPCANWGNWVAAAGLTGQRVNRFNTKKQLSDYDPNREYVNHWLRKSSAGVRCAGTDECAGSTEVKNVSERNSRTETDSRRGGGGGSKKGRWISKNRG